MSSNLTINISASDWSTINKRCYLLSVKELGGPLYASFEQFYECSTLVTLSEKWVSSTFGEIKDLLTSIDGISADFQQMITQIKSNYNPSSSITDSSYFSSIESSLTSLHTRISDLVSNAQSVADVLVQMSTLNAQAQTQILNSGLNVTPQQAKEYHFNSIQSAYGDVTTVFKKLIPQWVVLQGNLDQMINRLKLGASAVKQKEVISTVQILGAAKVNWNSIQSNSKVSLVNMQDQTSNLNGDFMYEGSPVNDHLKYALSFSGNQFLNSNSGSTLPETSTHMSFANPSFIWQFTKYKGGYYFMTTVQKTTSQTLYMKGSVSNATLEFTAANGNLGGLWRFVNNQGWCLTNAQVMFSAPGNNLSLNNTTVEVGQTQLFNPNPETITIQSI